MALGNKSEAVEFITKALSRDPSLSYLNDLLKQAATKAEKGEHPKKGGTWFDYAHRKRAPRYKGDANMAGLRSGVNGSGEKPQD